MPSERTLSPDEFSELNSMLPEAYKLLGFDENSLPNDNAKVVQKIDQTLGELRQQNLSEEEANNIAFPIGYLLGEKLRETVGWQWRYVTQDDGFESYGVVSQNKSHVYYAMNDVYNLLLQADDELNIMLLFNMIKSKAFPKRREKYISLG
jgi:hypothetical protein